jgi:hypothetical protein
MACCVVVHISLRSESFRKLPEGASVEKISFDVTKVSQNGDQTNLTMDENVIFASTAIVDLAIKIQTPTQTSLIYVTRDE